MGVVSSKHQQEWTHLSACFYEGKHWPSEGLCELLHRLTSDAHSAESNSVLLSSHQGDVEEEETKVGKFLIGSSLKMLPFD